MTISFLADGNWLGRWPWHGPSCPAGPPSEMLPASLLHPLPRPLDELVTQPRRRQLRQLLSRLVLPAQLLQRLRQQPARLRLEARPPPQPHRLRQTAGRLPPLPAQRQHLASPENRVSI